MKADLANLDLLRAFAVLLVVTGHFLLYAGKTPWTGWMGLTGVCLFFVHTCLVLMWSLERDPHALRFYIRRAFRLFPLWLAVLAFTVAIKLPISPDAAPAWRFHTSTPVELLANATLTFNLWFGAHIVGASWSLPIEAQMYLFLPLLFFIARTRHALAILLALDAAVLALVWIHHPHTETNLRTCIPYFLPGVIAYALTRRVRPTLPPWTFVLFLAAIAAAHHRFGNVFLSSFFCLAVGLALPFFRQITLRPLVRASHFIARYSYGIYLCHIPSLCLGLHYLHAHSIALRVAAFLAALTVSSVALYHAVEAPMIRLGSRIARRIEPGPSSRLNPNLEPAP